MFRIFAIYRSKFNTSLKNKYFPSKFIKLCPESLKEHTDKISLRSDETKHFIEVSNIYPTITLIAYIFIKINVGFSVGTIFE